MPNQPGPYDSEIRPVAMGFYPKLNEGSDSEIKAWAVSQESALSPHSANQSHESTGLGISVISGWEVGFGAWLREGTLSRSKRSS
jgi:hypothetical protein